VLIGTMSIRLSEDNHDSWVTYTTSAKCKTVITPVLTVLSGMEPHMISGNIGMGNGHILGWDMSKWNFIRLWVSHGETP
jgi:hypothetical protein